MTKCGLIAAVLATLTLTACADGIGGLGGNRIARGIDPPPAAGSSNFSEAGGIVIPSEKPDAEAKAYASRCSGGGASSVSLGMSECALIGIKGTPSRVISGLDQNGHAHNAIWYIENGQRVVYKFDDDKLIDIIR